MASELDAHQRPPSDLQVVFKTYQKLTLPQISADVDVIDFDRPSTPAGVTVVGRVHTPEPSDGLTSAPGAPIYECTALPGLRLIPNAVSQAEQRELLDRLLHRDLADPRHLTNVHKHHHLPYALCEPPEGAAAGASRVRSFFHLPNDTRAQLPPRDAAAHAPLSAGRFLGSRLRWLTLGGQYDWSAKAYPAGAPPAFPTDVAARVRALWPPVRPEAAIVNLYSPGDRLSLHRDVSEASRADLVSVSFGCDALFVAGVEAPGRAGACACAVVRLRSGDAVVMGGAARYAWHGVPRVLPGTCPEGLASWPAQDLPKPSPCEDAQFEPWQGWMAEKRVNLNVRQMYD